MSKQTSRQQRKAELLAVQMYMHSADVEELRQKIEEVSGHELEAVGFGLRFHAFRIEKAKERGELVEVQG